MDSIERAKLDWINSDLADETFGLEALHNDIASILADVALYKTSLVTPAFYEAWQSLAIDAAVWTKTDPIAGVAWAVDHLTYSNTVALCTINNGNNARLRSNKVWQASPGLSGIGFDGSRYIFQKLVVEFECTLILNPTEPDPNTFLVGLTPNAGDDRSSNNIIGFCANPGGGLDCITDAGGGETITNDPSWTNFAWHKFRIECSRGHVLFYTNGNLVADHTNNLPTSYGMYINFYCAFIGLIANFIIGPVRAWYE